MHTPATMPSILRMKRRHLALLALVAVAITPAVAAAAGQEAAVFGPTGRVAPRPTALPTHVRPPPLPPAKIAALKAQITAQLRATAIPLPVHLPPPPMPPPSSTQTSSPPPSPPPSATTWTTSISMTSLKSPTQDITVQLLSPDEVTIFWAHFPVAVPPPPMGTPSATLLWTNVGAAAGSYFVDCTVSGDQSNPHPSPFMVTLGFGYAPAQQVAATNGHVVVGLSANGGDDISLELSTASTWYLDGCTIDRMW